MGRKITVIGAGSVGSTITYTMAVEAIASEIVLIDINEEKAKGEAMDIRQGMPFSSSATVYAGTYSDAKDSDIVIITSGIPRKAGQSRIDLAQTNVNVIKQIAPQIVKYAPNAIYILVSNPVEVLTFVFMKVSGIPESRIIGSGTILDTSRLRSRIGEYIGISEKNIHAYVFDGFCASINSLESYFNISMKMLDEDVRADLFANRDRQIFTKVRNSAPTKYDSAAKVSNSMIADGCTIEGEVENSIIFRGVHVGRGSVVKNCILLQDTYVGSNVTLNCVVADKNVIIKEGRTLSGHETMPFFIDKGATV